MTDRPDVLFVGHGAERSGPPILLAHLQGWMAATTDLTTSTLLARGGPLVAAYERFGRVRVRDRGPTPTHLAQTALRRVGRHGSADRLEVERTRGVARRLGRARLVYANTVAPQTASLVRSVLHDDGLLIVHVHEMMSTLRHRIDDRDLRWLLDRADRVIAASGAVRRQLVEGFRVDEDEIAVCYEFVEPIAVPGPAERRVARERLGVSDDAFVIAGSGRIDWRKAPELLAQVLWRVRQEHPEIDARAVWIGAGGDDHWQLEHDLAAMGVDDRFTLAGEQVDPAPFVQAADVFALTSREDAFPLACLEAVGSERPLVTFDTGGMVEFVDAAGGGVVVPYPDIDGFATALADLAGDDDRRQALGRAGAQHVRRCHTVEAGAPPIVAEIRAVLDGSGR